MHPRNRHQGRYDFKKLTSACAELAGFVIPNPSGEPTIDFADPIAVRTLNLALLRDAYGIEFWEMPEGYLCPPIPGRADYVHVAADLLGAANKGVIPRGPSVRLLDVGVGASLIYPIIGHGEYGWSFVGSETDRDAEASAAGILEKNPALGSTVELRLQPSPSKIFSGVIMGSEKFDLTLCNPPFHASREEAEDASRRKWRNLAASSGNVGGKRPKKSGAKGPSTRPKPGGAPLLKQAGAPLLNFGGRDAELWCSGGEAGFIERMIAESAAYAKQVKWFTTLVSKEANLPAVFRQLKAARVMEFRTLDMSQGQKKSRAVAWTFQSH